MTINKVNDFEEILSILKLCSDDFFDKEAMAEDKLTELASKFSRFAEFLVFCEDENVLGFVAFYNNDPLNKVAFLSMIIVRSFCQGKKLGTHMLKYIIKQCKADGTEFLRLEVNKLNTRAINFYLKYNFVKEKSATEISDYYILDLRK